MLLQAETFWHRIKSMQVDDVPVYVTVTAATRGGLLVQYNHLEGFIPASHLGQVCSRLRVLHAARMFAGRRCSACRAL